MATPKRDDVRPVIFRKADAGSRRAILHRMWDELADYPAAETETALVHLMRNLSDLLQADQALWIGAVRMARGAAARRDGQHGWRGRVMRRLNPPGPELLERSLRAMREQESDPGLTTRAIAARAGAFRVHRLRDGFIDFNAFRRTAHYQYYYRDMGISDRMWIVFPVNEDTESYFVFDHAGARRRFTRSDAEFTGRALRALKWFHRKLMLNYGLHIAGTPLSSMQRRMAAMLLTDRTEREVAAELGLRPGTVHQYAVQLYQHFGVKGRAGLMALWLGK